MAKKVAEMLPEATFAAFVKQGIDVYRPRNLIAHYLSFELMAVLHR